MTFRFRRSLTLIPGVRINFSKSTPSISIGPRGAQMTFGRDGTRTTLGIPGSGLSWTNYQRHNSPSGGFGWLGWVMFVVGLVVVLLVR